MLVLYIRPTCPYCIKVMHEANHLGLVLDLKNIANPQHGKDLVARGGKRQVPYLLDEERGVEMYESEDIITYLHEYYKPTV